MKIEKLTPQIGAVIREINLNEKVTDDLIEKIKETFYENLVIFIEEQNISPRQFIRFAKHFGELGVYPFVKGMDDFPEIVEVRKKKDEKINFGGLWHTDTSYLPEPPASSMLYAVEIPPVGGDTLFSNMYLAYENLTPAYKAILSNLRGYNTSEKADAAVTRTHRIADSPKNTDSIKTYASHPIVRTHPITKKLSLYCSNAHTTHIEGMSNEESNGILKFLFSQQTKEEYTCRYKWKKGTIALWDNIACQHNALNDYHGFERVMYRITHKGVKPY